MTKKRFIDTKFWDDGYITELDPIEKLIFLYFITNPLTDICGIYEIPIKRIAFDTGIDKEMVSKIIERFAKDKKIYYIDGWIYVKNFPKHQVANESIKIGIEKSISLIPHQILFKIKELDTEWVQSGGRMCTESGLSKDNIKISIPTSSVKPKIFSYKETLLKWLNSPQRHIRVIAKFISLKELKFETHAQMQATLKRHLRPAVEVAKFSNNQIEEAFCKMTNNKELMKNGEWTIDTILKYLTK